MPSLDIPEEAEALARWLYETIGRSPLAGARSWSQLRSGQQRAWLRHAETALQAAPPALRSVGTRIAQLERERDQALAKGAEEERERLRGRVAAQLQRWARIKRRNAVDVVGDAEKLKLDWLAKGYDGAADLLLAALAAPAPSEQEEGK